MEGALQSVKALLTALASQFYNMIKDEIDSINAMINHVKESVREAMERMDQKLAEEEVSRIREERSESFQTSHQSVEVVMPCRPENNDDEEEESEVDEFLDSNSEFEDMGKDETAGEDGAVTRVADVVVGGEENKF